MPNEEGIAPTLLLAMPQLDDPNFHRSVVLLCRHGDEGALGFIVNRPLDVPVKELLVLEGKEDLQVPLTVWEGGPVSQERGWLLCRDQPAEGDTLTVCDGIFMSSSQTHLKSVLGGDPRSCAPDRARLLLGYAGWGPGQLNAELTASAWLMVPVDEELIFHTPHDKVWEAAIRSLGVEPSAIAPAPGVH
ncbi:MAG: YqgE/AlgH family protein [Deltaproteobacteria bacterium]|nr:YqgE/AlgH family protein [Deltaproteobacteria bacterium]